MLRLQGQAHKRARAMHMVPAGSEDAAADVASSEAHLKPSKVDTRNVSGKIVQVRSGLVPICYSRFMEVRITKKANVYSLSTIT